MDPRDTPCLQQLGVLDTPSLLQEGVLDTPCLLQHDELDTPSLLQDGVPPGGTPARRVQQHIAERPAATRSATEFLRISSVSRRRKCSMSLLDPRDTPCLQQLGVLDTPSLLQEGVLGTPSLLEHVALDMPSLLQGGVLDTSCNSSLQQL